MYEMIHQILYKMISECSDAKQTTVNKSSLLAIFALLPFLSFSLSKTVLMLLYSALLFSFLSIPSRSPLVRGEDFGLLTMHKTTFPRAWGDSNFAIIAVVLLTVALSLGVSLFCDFLVNSSLTFKYSFSLSRYF